MSTFLAQIRQMGADQKGGSNDLQLAHFELTNHWKWFACTVVYLSQLFQLRLGFLTVLFHPTANKDDWNFLFLNVGHAC